MTKKELYDAIQNFLREVMLTELEQHENTDEDPDDSLGLMDCCHKDC